MKLHRKKKGLIRFPYLKYQFIPCQKVIVMNISSRHLFNVVRHRNPLWLAHGMFSEQEKERERREKAGLWSSKVVLVCHVSFFFLCTFESNGCKLNCVLEIVFVQRYPRNWLAQSTTYEHSNAATFALTI